MTSTTTMMKEAIQALYPPRLAASRRRVRRSGSSFSSSNESFHENSLPQFRLDANATTPNRPPTSYSASSKRKPKSGFSELLLEHGEKDLHQDWAVCASSTPASATGNSGICGGISCSSQMKQIEGRLRICSQSIVFEPHQISRGIIRAPFKTMTYLGGGNKNRNSKTLIHDFI